MKLEEIYRKVKESPFDNIYLRRKRRFTMGETDVIYGDHEQTDFCVVFSPDKLDTQYPLMDITAKLGRQKPISVNTDYKHEYFPMSNSDVQSCIRQETASDILDRFNVFLEFADWYEPESNQS
jgi:hypothetical protein